MKSTIKTTMIAAIALLTFLSQYSFSQASKFSISLNSLTTNFHYGESNSMHKKYKQNDQGLQAGFSYQAGISPFFSIVPEIYVARKGGSLKENNPVTSVKSTVRLYSIDIPILARIHFDKLYVNAGPYAGYIVSGRIKTHRSGLTPAQSIKLGFGNSSTGLKRWDFGVLAGAGYNFNTKNKILTLDARYGYGLINISRDLPRYNRVLNISLVVSKVKTR